jgi:hypothetical protein
LKELFDYQAWLEANEFALFELFVLYAIIKKYDLEFATVSFPVNRLVSSDTGIIDSDKIQERKKGISDEIEKLLGKDTVDQNTQIINDRAKDEGCPRLDYVSGKDYAMPLLLMRMRRMVKFRAENAVLKQRLAMKCDVSGLTEISSWLTQKLIST